MNAREETLKIIKEILKKISELVKNIKLYVKRIDLFDKIIDTSIVAEKLGYSILLMINPKEDIDEDLFREDITEGGYIEEDPEDFFEEDIELTMVKSQRNKFLDHTKQIGFKFLDDTSKVVYDAMDIEVPSDDESPIASDEDEESEEEYEEESEEEEIKPLTQRRRIAIKYE